MAKAATARFVLGFLKSADETDEDADAEGLRAINYVMLASCLNPVAFCKNE